MMSSNTTISIHTIASNSQTESVNLGISACLTGQPVRFNGAHKGNEVDYQTLSLHCNLIPVCPEVGSGLSVPRNTIDLIWPLGDSAPHAQNRQHQGINPTDEIKNFAHIWLATQRLHGFVAMQRSPSCALSSAKIYRPESDSPFSTRGRGLFTSELKYAFPGLPTYEAQELSNLDALYHLLVCAEVYKLLTTAIVEQHSQDKLHLTLMPVRHYLLTWLSGIGVTLPVAQNCPDAQLSTPIFDQLRDSDSNSISLAKFSELSRPMRSRYDYAQILKGMISDLPARRTFDPRTATPSTSVATLTERYNRVSDLSPIPRKLHLHKLAESLLL
ncbi:hypothetical protein OLMES_2500 [Oleiphilus messinensis]|uniref:Uncharacterized protein n=1 Tax=Oleiphilus messinensis TaxID=141451 RepID=A0A1Y0I8N4_9GAMM|nr:DUF523 domain-containing protein [Oleiphilus messinensis]ARU56559.1 hypothetical protein OLMES_2500 [Oleiphilus messinensis]